MDDFGTSTRLTAIIVGGSEDQFVYHARNLLIEYELEFDMLDDIYSAVAHMVKYGNTRGLVIGRLEQLGREKGRFFQIARQHGFLCCCLAGKYNSQNHQIQAAKEAEVSVINEPSELTGIVARFLAVSCANAPAKMIKRGSLSFIKDEFLTTKDELDALLASEDNDETENIFD